MFRKIKAYIESLFAVSDEFIQGVDAANRGDAENACPYAAGSQQANDWLAGFKHGQWKPLG